MRLAENEPAIVLGFEDEAWWSRESQPALHTWSASEPLHQPERKVPADDPERKAMACYGLYVPTVNQMLVRFVQGRPVSAVTCAFLAWLLTLFAAQRKRALFLIWDNASWHRSQAVRDCPVPHRYRDAARWKRAAQDWIKTHNRKVKAQGGCRLISCRLPSKSPWLNAVEPKWVHGKRAVSESERLLPISELMQRVCGYYQCELLAPLSQPAC